ncbi:MAG: hypothetical protein Q9175_007936, partial [Cornicularia normoerica]
MGVTRTVLEHGNGDQPNKGDEIAVHYTGFVYDDTNNCRGWDEGIMEMRVGEKSILRIS